MNNYKRQYRELDDATKQKISQKLKGKSKSMSHKENLSNSMREYWKGVPHSGKTGADWDSAPEQTGTLLMMQN